MTFGRPDFKDLRYLTRKEDRGSTLLGSRVGHLWPEKIWGSMKRFACFTCRDLGLLEIRQADLVTMAKCSCERGQSLVNGWSLPSIPIEGWEPNGIEMFKPTKDLDRAQKILWWAERVKTAEEFWRGQK